MFRIFSLSPPLSLLIAFFSILGARVIVVASYHDNGDEIRIIFLSDEAIMVSALFDERDETIQ